MPLKRKFVALPLIFFSRWPYFNPWKKKYRQQKFILHSNYSLNCCIIKTGAKYF